MRRRRCAPLLAGAGLLLAVGVQAQAAADDAGWWTRARDTVEHVYRDGSNDLYLSGYAYHGRGTYTAQRIDELNEKIWGAGFGKTLRDGGGNEELLYAMGTEDSHRQLELLAGYAYQWMWPLGNSGLEAGAGYTVLMISRADYFDRFPFPALLPVASFGTRRVKLEVSYVPRLSGNKGNGDVALAFLKIQLK